MPKGNSTQYPSTRNTAAALASPDTRRPYSTPNDSSAAPSRKTFRRARGPRSRVAGGCEVGIIVDDTPLVGIGQPGDGLPAAAFPTPPIRVAQPSHTPQRQRTCQLGTEAHPLVPPRLERQSQGRVSIAMSPIMDRGCFDLA
ncbi:MAG: hypothetical protein E4H37_00495 [Gemmatimonadales bacterium]|nr:MAG: hypothetical protein E4H37_00495 [Gemmatimonadales bacterium]